MVAEASTKTEGADGKKESVATKKLQKSDVAEKLSKATICIKQIGSPIRRDPRQTLYLSSLGLGKLNRVRHVVDNPSTRGLLDKLRHMVVVVEQ
jgi:large subunit ribosomal protein L30